MNSDIHPCHSGNISASVVFWKVENYLHWAGPFSGRKQSKVGRTVLSGKETRAMIVSKRTEP
jgi:hypothetical protein